MYYPLYRVRAGLPSPVGFNPRGNTMADEPTADGRSTELTSDGISTNLTRLQAAVGEWSQENFGDDELIMDNLSQRLEAGGDGADVGALFTVLGVNEEAGELTHSVLKRAQGIRGDEDGVGVEAEKDAVGDIIVYLADFCYRRGYDLDECVKQAWDGEVSDREWDSETRKGGE